MEAMACATRKAKEVHDARLEKKRQRKEEKAKATASAAVDAADANDHNNDVSRDGDDDNDHDRRTIKRPARASQSGQPLKKPPGANVPPTRPQTSPAKRKGQPGFKVDWSQDQVVCSTGATGTGTCKNMRLAKFGGMEKTIPATKRWVAKQQKLNR